jgi:hypothetical protein
LKLGLIVYFLIVNSSDYFEYLSVWVPYAMLFLAPLLRANNIDFEGEVDAMEVRLWVARNGCTLELVHMFGCV